MGLFSSTLSPKEVVDQVIREGVQSCKITLSRIGGVPGARQTNELMLTWLAMDRVTWEVALSRLHGEAIDQIRTATSKHYGEILLRELAKHLDTPRRVSREEKRLLAISFAQQIRGRAEALGREWNAHRHDRPGPEYWTCKRAVKLMGLDESNPTYVTRLSARVTPTLINNMEFIRDVARRIKV